MDYGLLDTTNVTKMVIWLIKCSTEHVKKYIIQTLNLFHS